MNVLIHDESRCGNSRRREYIESLAEQRVQRFGNQVHRVDVRISEGTCRVTASLGALGTVVATVAHHSMHNALSGAFQCATRLIDRKLAKRTAHQKHREVSLDATGKGPSREIVIQDVRIDRTSNDYTMWPNSRLGLLSDAS